MLIALLLIAAGLAVLGAASVYLPPRVAGRSGAGLLLIGLVLSIAVPFTGPAELGPFRLDALSAWAAACVVIASSPSVLAAERWSGLVAGASLFVVLATFPLLALGLVILGGVAGWRRIGHGAVGAACFYVVARMGLASVLPIGWGLSVLGVGLLVAIGGGASAASVRRFGAALPGLAALTTGLAAAGLGLSMAARGADLLPAAALGLEAALLFVVTGAVSLAALDLAAAAIRTQAGADDLAELGGLWPGMRATGLSAVIAGASLAVLPPSAGFASFYLLLQALFAASRIGGVFVQFGLACAAAACGVAAGVGALAILRLIGLGLLGQPRTALAARDPVGDPRLLMAGLAALGVLLSVAPGGALLLAAPVLTEAGLPTGATLLLPTFVAGVLAASCAAVWACMRQAPRARRVPAWEGGLPGSAQLVPYVPGLLAAMRWRPRPRWPTLRETLAVAALALAVVLIVLAAR